MVTWPAVMHWLSVVPIADFIRDMLDRICCDSLLDMFDDVLQKYPERDPQTPASTDTLSSPDTFSDAANSFENISFAQSMHFVSGSLASGLGLDLDTKVSSFSAMIDSALERGGEPLELGAVLNAVSPRFKLPDNGRKLSAVEAKNLPTLLLSEVMVKPVLSTFIGSSKAAARIADFQLGLGGVRTDAAASEDVQTQIEALRAQIEELQNRLDG